MVLKVKAVPLQAQRGPEGSRKLRFPDFVTTLVGCQPYAPAAFTPRKYSWYSFLSGAESTPGPWCDRKDFMSMKIPMTPVGIETATFRFVAQHLNHCATAVPGFTSTSTYILSSIRHMHAAFIKHILRNYTTICKTSPNVSIQTPKQTKHKINLVAKEIVYHNFLKFGMCHIILACKISICHAQSSYSVMCTAISAVKFTFI